MQQLGASFGSAWVCASLLLLLLLLLLYPARASALPRLPQAAAPLLAPGHLLRISTQQLQRAAEGLGLEVEVEAASEEGVQVGLLAVDVSAFGCSWRASRKWV